MTLATRTSMMLANSIRRLIDVVAADLAPDEFTRRDLRQEMLLHLWTLPEGQARNYYERCLWNHARNYWARQILDAPHDRRGRPILERQTVAVGGLAELDRVHRRQSAA